MAKRSRNGQIIIKTQRPKKSKENAIASAESVLDQSQWIELETTRQSTLSALFIEQLQNVNSRLETFIAEMKVDDIGAEHLWSQRESFAHALSNGWKASWNTLRTCKKSCAPICACLHEARMMVSRNQARNMSDCFAQMVEVLVEMIGRKRESASFLQSKRDVITTFLSLTWDPPKDRAARTQLVCKNATRHQPFRSALEKALEIHIPEQSQVDDVLRQLQHIDEKRTSTSSLGEPSPKRCRLDMFPPPLPALEGNLPPLPLRLDGGVQCSRIEGPVWHAQYLPSYENQSVSGEQTVIVPIPRLPEVNNGVLVQPLPVIQCPSCSSKDAEINGLRQYCRRLETRLDEVQFGLRKLLEKMP